MATRYEALLPEVARREATSVGEIVAEVEVSEPTAMGGYRRVRRRMPLVVVEAEDTAELVALPTQGLVPLSELRRVMGNGRRRSLENSVRRQRGRRKARAKEVVKAGRRGA